jgi:hypothetical protein
MLSRAQLAVQYLICKSFPLRTHRHCADYQAHWRDAERNVMYLVTGSRSSLSSSLVDSTLRLQRSRRVLKGWSRSGYEQV